jgi:myo-inositol catabolism protein IolC
LESRPLYIDSLLEEIANVFSHQTAEKVIKFIIHIDPETPLALVETLETELNKVLELLQLS